MLPDETILNAKTIAEIVQIGYTRIPVYSDGDRNNVTGLLIVKGDGCSVSLVPQAPQIAKKIKYVARTATYFILLGPLGYMNMNMVIWILSYRSLSGSSAVSSDLQLMRWLFDYLKKI